MKIINEDICNVTEGYIFQQSNCVTLSPYGLSKTLEEKFPGTCPYKFRQPAKTKYGTISNNVADKKTRSVPGTVYILSNENSPHIVNMFAQYAPGKPGIWKPLQEVDTDYFPYDSYVDRERYFEKCLDAMLDFFEFSEDEIKIAIPYKIGCGLAGGNWTNYEKMILDFEEKAGEMGLNMDITIYKL